MTTEEKEFVIQEVGPVRVTTNGNRYLTCETDLGRVAFWGSERNQRNIKGIRLCAVPVHVRAGAIPSRWSQHVLWVPQTAKIQVFVEREAAGSKNKRAGAAGKEETNRGTTSGERSRLFDPYSVLGVARNASLADIRRAYRELIKQYHPDHVARLGKELRDLANAKTQEINRAYDLLTGTKRRPA
jgi:hypothetical protein